MYKFVAPDKAASALQHVTTTFGGVLLDRSTSAGEVRTLNITGRGFVSQRATTTNKPAAAGVWLDNIQINKRAITVEVLLRAGNQDDLIVLHQELNLALIGDIKDLSFSDQEGWHYRAAYTGTSAGKEDSLSMIVVLSFECFDPYLYADDVSVYNIDLEAAEMIEFEDIGGDDEIEEPEINGDDWTVPDDYPNPVVPELIFADVTGIELLKVTNATTGRNIVVHIEDMAVEFVLIKWLDDKVEVLGGLASDGTPETFVGTSIMSSVDILSDIETFSVKAGDIVSHNAVSDSLLIELRKRRL